MLRRKCYPLVETKASVLAEWLVEWLVVSALRLGVKLVVRCYCSYCAY